MSTRDSAQPLIRPGMCWSLSLVKSEDPDKRHLVIPSSSLSHSYQTQTIQTRNSRLHKGKIYWIHFDTERNILSSSQLRHWYCENRGQMRRKETDMIFDESLSEQ